MRMLAIVTDWALGLLMLFLFLVIFLQVMGRYLLNFSFAPSEELATLLFGWIVFLGCGICLAEGRHLGVAFIQDALPRRLRHVARCVVDVAILGFLVFCVITGWKLASIFGYYRYTALQVSRYWLFLAVPVGCLVAIPIMVKILVADIRGDLPTQGGMAHKQDQLS